MMQNMLSILDSLDSRVPCIGLEVDDFELGFRDGAAGGEEAGVGRIATVFALLPDIGETQIVQEP